MDLKSKLDVVRGIIRVKHISLSKNASACVYIMMLNRKKSKTKGNIYIQYGYCDIMNDGLLNNQRMWKKSYQTLYTHVYVMSDIQKASLAVDNISQGLSKFHVDFKGRSDILDIPDKGIEVTSAMIKGYCLLADKHDC